MEKVRVGIYLFDEVEVLDFAGPYEVFSRTRLSPGVESRRADDSAPFEVFTVSATREMIFATGGLQVSADYDFSTAPKIDILVVPGGFGTRPLLNNSSAIRWIKRTAQDAQLVTSVCTGSLLLASAGLLHERQATTHWGALQSLNEIDPTILVQTNERLVSDGVITSAGVSAGIDMAIHVVESMYGKDVADDTARYMDYPRTAEKMLINDGNKKFQIDQVRRFYNVLWDAHDKSEIPSVLHNDVSFRGSLGVEKHGHDGFAEYTDFVHGALGEFRCVIDDVVSDGNTVFAKMTFRGIHQNELLNFVATGKQVEWPGCVRFTFDGDLISDVWVLGDLVALEAQLEANRTSL